MAEVTLRAVYQDDLSAEFVASHRSAHDAAQDLEDAVAELEKAQKAAEVQHKQSAAATQAHAKADKEAARAQREAASAAKERAEAERRSEDAIANSVKALALSYLTIQAGKQVFIESINLHRDHERVLRQLRTAGFANVEAVDAHTESLEALTGVSSTAIAAQIAMARQMGASESMSKLLAQAALDASAAIGGTFEERARQLAKSLGGYAGELGEIIPETKAFTREQLQAGAAVELVARKYAGAAESIADSFSKMENAWKDVQVSIGELTTGLGGLDEGAAGAAGALDLWADAIRGADSALTPLLDRLADSSDILGGFKSDLEDIATRLAAIKALGSESIGQRAVGAAQLFFGGEATRTPGAGGIGRAQEDANRASLAGRVTSLLDSEVGPTLEQAGTEVKSFVLALIEGRLALERGVSLRAIPDFAPPVGDASRGFNPFNEQAGPIGIVPRGRRDGLGFDFDKEIDKLFDPKRLEPMDLQLKDTLTDAQERSAELGIVLVGGLAESILLAKDFGDIMVSILRSLAAFAASQIGGLQGQAIGTGLNLVGSAFNLLDERQGQNIELRVDLDGTTLARKIIPYMDKSRGRGQVFGTP